MVKKKLLNIIKKNKETIKKRERNKYKMIGNEEKNKGKVVRKILQIEGTI